MPFGLTNILTLKQELINNIFKDILDKYIIIYLNNTLVYSSGTLDNYIKKVYEVLRWFNKKDLRFKPKNYHFHREKVQFLQYIIRRNRVYINPQKVTLIKKWLKPTNITEVQSFLGFINFNRQFIRDYFTIIKPITHLIKNIQPFYWTEKQEKAFLIFKRNCAELTVL